MFMLWRRRIKVLDRVPVALFVIAVPVLLVIGSVTWAINDLRLYEHGFDELDVPITSGIEKAGLMEAAREIRGYFNSNDEPLEVTAVVFGVERELFKPREVLHMRDVKRLIWGAYGAGAAAALYILAYAAVGFGIRRQAFAPYLSRYLLWGSGLTVGAVVLVGLIALVGFDSLFLLFHKVSFSNDLWQLDSRTDYLVIMFPQGFWLDATLFVALSSVAQALALAGISGGFLLFRRRSERKGESTLLRPTSTAAEL